MDIPNPGAGEKSAEAGAAVMQAFYQRVDLSGEYPVEASGAIAIPLFGSIQASGKTLEGVRADIGAAFEKTFGRRGGVTVGLTQRAPVFVAGAVRSPGAFPYSGGMIVVQALALAGGVERDAMNSAQVVELLREVERQTAVRDRLKRALARKAALLARQNAAVVPVVERLRTLVPEGEVKALLAAAGEIVRLETDLSAGEDDTRRNTAEAAASEVELLRKRLAAFDAQLAARGERLKAMEAFYARQVVESERVADIRRDVTDMEARKRDFEVSVMQAEFRQGAAREAVERAASRQRLALEKEMSTLDAEIAAAEHSLVISLNVASTLGANPGGATMRYQIVRTTANGARVLPAEETDLLEPGDVLKVGPARGPAGRSDRIEAASR
ncbi:MAG: SLBB domain-containing protein [Methylobacterium frigidaeris]